jgi:transcriptional regulator with XRE-family HTH domain
LVSVQFSGIALRSLRRQAGLNRDVLAFAVGRTTGTIANYEQGRTVPSAEIVARLADYLGCHVEDFFIKDGAHV